MKRRVSNNLVRRFSTQILVLPQTFHRHSTLETIPFDTGKTMNKVNCKLEGTDMLQPSHPVEKNL